ncbi:MAG: hypothetical protein DDT38_01049 [Firmicutes bacterium]|nr:hypothetical protein [candidate division NPL-UPA2 bacterium]
MEIVQASLRIVPITPIPIRVLDPHILTRGVSRRDQLTPRVIDVGYYLRACAIEDAGNIPLAVTHVVVLGAAQVKANELTLGIVGVDDGIGAASFVGDLFSYPAISGRDTVDSLLSP